MSTYTQTAEEASAKVLRFPDLASCRAYIAAHGILAQPCAQGDHYIAICFLTAGVFGVSSPTTCELLPDW